MNKRLRILHLEDDADFSAFVRDLLSKENILADLQLVSNQADFHAALANEQFDIILADYSLPDFTGFQALDVARVECPLTPFVLVSGTIGEQVAIESLHAGATDYVLKQTPDRLAPAVMRAVREAEERAKRKRAESELLRREKYFRALTYNSLDLLSVVNAEGVFQYNSPSMKRVVGYDPEELIGHNVFDFIHSGDLFRARASFQRCIESPDSAVTIEYRFRHREGHWIYLESVAQSRLNDPDIAAVLAASRDVTERKRMENQRDTLSTLGLKLSSVSAPEEAARIIYSTAERLFDWEVFMLDLYSAENDEMFPVLNVDTIEGKRKEVFTGAITHKPSGMARRILERGAELILRDDTSTMLPDAIPIGDITRPSASLMLAPVRNRNRVVGILAIHSYRLNAYTQADLDTMQVLADYCGGALERIRSREDLLDSEERLRNVFAASPDAIFVESVDGDVLDVNTAACRLHGFERDQLIGRNVVELVPPTRRSEVARDFKQFVAGTLSWVESESLTSTGSITPVEVRATRIQYGGEPAILLHVRDISERQNAEVALRSSEALFRSVWENSVDGMRLTDENGIVVAVNKAFCNLVGLARHEMEGKPFTEIYADAEQPDRILKKYQQRFRDRVIERQIERRLTLRNGSVVVFEDTNSFVELRGQSPLLLGLFRDVTAQKRLEEQLRQSQKMDAIGKLAGGVAHDFNNILTVIHGHASLLLAANAWSDFSAKSAQQIVHAADRAAGLTRQLLTFSRRQVMQPRRLDLNDAVEHMTSLLSRILGEDIALNVDKSPEPPLVHADASMMEQVVLNLAVNSRDAMPKGGRLDISIRIIEIDDRHRTNHPESRFGRFVRLTVTDTGTGIAPENIQRIFEPFFTTKQVGKGTGLGLATVYGVARQHHGWVEVDSEPGRGASFKVFFPYIGEVAPSREEKPTDHHVRGGNETILVVEDEAPVRELVCSILKHHGYEILQAESGVKALEVWRGHANRIDLLLTDIVMPDRMNGWELAETLLAQRPDLKVVFTSGYSDDIVGREFVSQQGSKFLQKPYEPKKLAATVRKCLDEAEPVVAR